MDKLGRVRLKSRPVDEDGCAVMNDEDELSAPKRLARMELVET